MTAWVRLLLAVVCGVAVTSIYVAQPMLGPMGRDLGVEAAATGWFVAAGQIGYLAGLVLLVPLGDKLDRRRLIAAQLALTASGLLMAAWAPAAWVALVGLAVAGVFAVVVQIAVAYAASVSPASERGRNIGVVTSGVVIGILGGRVIAGTFAQVWGWQSTYVLLGVLALALAAGVLLALPADGERGEVQPARPLPQGTVGLFADHLFWSRGLIAFFAFASFGVLWSGMALPLADPPWSMNAAQVGLFGIVGLVGALGARRAGRWADVGRARPMSGIALALLLVSWVLIAQLPWSLMLLVAGVVVLDFAVQVAHVSNQHLLTEANPSRTSTTIGGYMVFYCLGSALGAAATTQLYTFGGWVACGLLGGVFATGALVVWAISERIMRAAPPDRLRMPHDDRQAT